MVYYQTGVNACLLLPEAFTFHYSTVSGNTVVFELMGSSPFANSPSCSRISSKVHSYYQQKVQDLPISGRTVKRCIVSVR